MTCMTGDSTFSQLSRGTGTLAGSGCHDDTVHFPIKEAALPDIYKFAPVVTAIRDPRNARNVRKKIRKHVNTIVSDSADHHAVGEVDGGLKLPHVHKTYSTRHGALLLFAEDYFDESKQNRDSDSKKPEQMMAELRTLRELRDMVLDYGSDDAHVVKHLMTKMQRGTESKYVHVRPGFSAPRYLTSLTKLWKPGDFEHFINNNQIDASLIEKYLSTYSLPDVTVDGAILRDSLLRDSPRPYKSLDFMLPNIRQLYQEIFKGSKWGTESEEEENTKELSSEADEGDSLPALVIPSNTSLVVIPSSGGGDRKEIAEEADEADEADDSEQSQVVLPQIASKPDTAPDIADDFYKVATNSREQFQHSTNTQDADGDYENVDINFYLNNYLRHHPPPPNSISRSNVLPDQDSITTQKFDLAHRFMLNGIEMSVDERVLHEALDEARIPATIGNGNQKPIKGLRMKDARNAEYSQLTSEDREQLLVELLMQRALFSRKTLNTRCLESEIDRAVTNEWRKLTGRDISEADAELLEKVPPHLLVSLPKLLLPASERSRRITAQRQRLDDAGSARERRLKSMPTPAGVRYRDHSAASVASSGAQLSVKNLSLSTKLPPLDFKSLATTSKDGVTFQSIPVATNKAGLMLTPHTIGSGTPRFPYQAKKLGGGGPVSQIQQNSAPSSAVSSPTLPPLKLTGHQRHATVGAEHAPSEKLGSHSSSVIDYLDLEVSRSPRSDSASISHERLTNVDSARSLKPAARIKGQSMPLSSRTNHTSTARSSDGSTARSSAVIAQSESRSSEMLSATSRNSSHHSTAEQSSARSRSSKHSTTTSQRSSVHRTEKSAEEVAGFSDAEEDEISVATSSDEESDWGDGLDGGKLSVRPDQMASQHSPDNITKSSRTSSQLSSTASELSDDLSRTTRSAASADEGNAQSAASSDEESERAPSEPPMLTTTFGKQWSLNEASNPSPVTKKNDKPPPLSNVEEISEAPRVLVEKAAMPVELVKNVKKGGKKEAIQKGVKNDEAKDEDLPISEVVVEVERPEMIIEEDEDVSDGSSVLTEDEEEEEVFSADVIVEPMHSSVVSGRTIQLIQPILEVQEGGVGKVGDVFTITSGNNDSIHRHVPDVQGVTMVDIRVEKKPSKDVAIKIIPPTSQGSREQKPKQEKRHKHKHDTLKDKVILEALEQQIGATEWAKRDEQDRQSELIKFKLEQKKLRKEGKEFEAAQLVDDLLTHDVNRRKSMGDNKQQVEERLAKRKAMQAAGMASEEIELLEKQEDEWREAEASEVKEQKPKQRARRTKRTKEPPPKPASPKEPSAAVVTAAVRWLRPTKSEDEAIIDEIEQAEQKAEDKLKQAIKVEALVQPRPASPSMDGQRGILLSAVTEEDPRATHMRDAIEVSEAFRQLSAIKQAANLATVPAEGKQVMDGTILDRTPPPPRNREKPAARRRQPVTTGTDSDTSSTVTSTSQKRHKSPRMRDLDMLSIQGHSKRNSSAGSTKSVATTVQMELADHASQFLGSPSASRVGSASTTFSTDSSRHDDGRHGDAAADVDLEQLEREARSVARSLLSARSGHFGKDLDNDIAEAASMLDERLASGANSVASMKSNEQDAVEDSRVDTSTSQTASPSKAKSKFDEQKKKFYTNLQSRKLSQASLRSSKTEENDQRKESTSSKLRLSGLETSRAGGDTITPDEHTMPGASYLTLGDSVDDEPFDDRVSGRVSGTENVDGGHIIQAISEAEEEEEEEEDRERDRENVRRDRLDDRLSAAAVDGEEEVTTTAEVNDARVEKEERRRMRREKREERRKEKEDAKLTKSFEKSVEHEKDDSKIDTHIVDDTTAVEDPGDDAKAARDERQAAKEALREVKRAEREAKKASREAERKSREAEGASREAELSRKASRDADKVAVIDGKRRFKQLESDQVPLQEDVNEDASDVDKSQATTRRKERDAAKTTDVKEKKLAIQDPQVQDVDKNDKGVQEPASDRKSRKERAEAKPGKDAESVVNAGASNIDESEVKPTKELDIAEEREEKEKPVKDEKPKTGKPSKAEKLKPPSEQQELTSPDKLSPRSPSKLKGKDGKSKKSRKRSPRPSPITEKESPPPMTFQTKEEKGPAGLKGASDERKVKKKVKKDVKGDDARTNGKLKEEFGEVALGPLFEEIEQPDHSAEIIRPSTRPSTRQKTPDYETADIIFREDKVTGSRPPQRINQHGGQSQQQTVTNVKLNELKNKRVLDALQQEKRSQKESRDHERKLKLNEAKEKRAQAAEKRREEVERKRKEKEEQKRQEEETARLMGIKEKEAEEEKLRRIEQFKQMKRDEEEKKGNEEAELLAKQNEGKLAAEREKNDREKYQQKMLQIAEKLRLEAERKHEQEQLAAQLEAEMKRKEEEMLQAMEEGDRIAYQENKRREEEAHAAAERDRLERLRLKHAEEEQERERMMKEMEEMHRIVLEKRLFNQGVKRANQILDINQKLSQAFTYSYIELLPAMMYLYSGSDGRQAANLPPGERFEPAGNSSAGAAGKMSELEKIIGEFAAGREPPDEPEDPDFD